MKQQILMIVTVIACIFYLQIESKAQVLLPGMIDMTPSINTSINNEIDMARMRILNGSISGRPSAAVAEASRRKAIEQRGMQVIKAGKATLIFIPSNAGTLKLVKTLTFDQTEPQTLSGQIALVQGYVSRFNKLLPKAGYQVNNINDGFALSYAIAYTAFYDKKPEIADIHEMRQTYGKGWLDNAPYQGLSNAEKQYSYERWALMAMQAIDQRENARKAMTQQERHDAEEKAKMYAKYVLDDKR